MSDESDLFAPPLPPTVSAAPRAVSVGFSGSQARYDYLVPDGMEVGVGDQVRVETRRGVVTVMVFDVLDHSEKATAWILGVAQ